MLSPTHIHDVHDVIQEGQDHILVSMLQEARATQARAAGDAKDALRREARAEALRVDAIWLFHIAEVASC